jgi:hypothetical protein
MAALMQVVVFHEVQLDAWFDTVCPKELLPIFHSCGALLNVLGSMHQRVQPPTPAQAVQFKRPSPLAFLARVFVRAMASISRWTRYCARDLDQLGTNARPNNAPSRAP